MNESQEKTLMDILPCLTKIEVTVLLGLYSVGESGIRQKPLLKYVQVSLRGARYALNRLQEMGYVENVEGYRLTGAGFALFERGHSQECALEEESQPAPEKTICLTDDWQNLVQRARAYYDRWSGGSERAKSHDGSFGDDDREPWVESNVDDNDDGDDVYDQAFDEILAAYENASYDPGGGYENAPYHPGGGRENAPYAGEWVRERPIINMLLPLLLYSLLPLYTNLGEKRARVVVSLVKRRLEIFEEVEKTIIKKEEELKRRRRMDHTRSAAGRGYENAPFGQLGGRENAPSGQQSGYENAPFNQQRGYENAPSIQRMSSEHAHTGQHTGDKNGHKHQGGGRENAPSGQQAGYENAPSMQRMRSEHAPTEQHTEDKNGHKHQGRGRENAPSTQRMRNEYEPTGQYPADKNGHEHQGRGRENGLPVLQGGIEIGPTGQRVEVESVSDGQHTRRKKAPAGARAGGKNGASKNGRQVSSRVVKRGRRHSHAHSQVKEKSPDLPEPDPALMEACKIVGIKKPAMLQIARLKHLTPEHIFGHEELLQRERRDKYTTGALIKVLLEDVQPGDPPPTEEEIRDACKCGKCEDCVRRGLIALEKRYKETGKLS